jgi:NAD(P)-dependent dehydrogenase (short-subunit alcohol dehydrogenase family)
MHDLIDETTPACAGEQAHITCPCEHELLRLPGAHAMRHAIIIGLSLLIGMPLLAPAAEPETGAQKAILVTGASSGIGRKITERLAAAGHFVYAGARKEADLKELAGIKNVQPVRLDVTNEKDIAAAVDSITKGGRGLHGLVNNAGIGTLGPLPSMKPEEFDLVMAVNVKGPYLVTRAFAPLIIAQKGRITTIGSISGILAGRNSGAYSMSKHAIEAFVDALAGDMEPTGVHVSVIEPGNYNSEIAKNAIERVGQAEVERIGGNVGLGDRSRFKEPDEVADAALHALLDPNPKRRYMVVPNEREAEVTIRKQIAQLVQLNEGQPYTYDREGLIKLLDEALAQSRPRTK